MCRNAKIPTFPQVARNLVEKVEAEAWRTASSQVLYFPPSGSLGHADRCRTNINPNAAIISEERCLFIYTI